MTTEPTPIPFGAKVQVSKVYRRVRHRKGGYVDTACWEAHDVSPHTGICIGYRTLSNGDRWWEDEAGYVYNPKEHFRAMLVVFSAYTNPEFIPMDAVEEAAQ